MSGSGGSGVLAQERVKLLVVRSVLKHGCVGPGRVMVGEHSGSWRSATVPQLDQVGVSQDSVGFSLTWTKFEELRTNLKMFDF